MTDRCRFIGAMLRRKIVLICYSGMRLERYYNKNAVSLAQTRLTLACQGAELGRGLIELKQHSHTTLCRDFLVAMLFRTRCLGFDGTHNYAKFLGRCISGSAKQYDDESHREARTWLARFNANTIPKNICEVTFSRSSGPGGQNVNKYGFNRPHLQVLLQY